MSCVVKFCIIVILLLAERLKNPYFSKGIVAYVFVNLYSASNEKVDGMPKWQSYNGR